ncbi:XIAP-associated factor 1 [Periophthalmus magnuspinnatus]|uniref:XIAP-associated factor 1 n=1 Tax=Periophthalmus magnuspinnatus TaxID=409849 RepID=UPI00145A3660|nr:XIAP-associated factor 1 [Periophthalmus magnuspinnatus]
MGDEEATRVCARCKREVAEANFALHETHCSRFLVLCPDCGENVPRSDLQQHKQEQHTQVRCLKCQKKMERCLLPEHEEEECPARVEACAFCELEMPFVQLQEHIVACGSRTERCLDCGQYVKLSDQEEHNRVCSEQDLYNEPSSPPKGTSANVKTTTPTTTTTASKPDVQCKVCMLTFSANEIQRHMTRCTAAPKCESEDSDSDSDYSYQASGVDLLSPRFKIIEFRQTNGQINKEEQKREASQNEDNDPNELSICPHCQLVLPWSTLRWHVNKCKVHIHLKHREAAV